MQYSSLMCARHLTAPNGSLLWFIKYHVGSTVNIETYSSSTCTPGTITSRTFQGTVGQCNSAGYYSTVNTLWISSDITSLPTSPPTSAGTFLTGYLTTSAYSYGNLDCTVTLSAETLLLGSCVSNSNNYQKTVATSTTIATMTYSDALCQTLTSTTFEYYKLDVCSKTYSTSVRYSISSKVTTDLIVPRVTLT